MDGICFEYDASVAVAAAQWLEMNGRSCLGAIRIVIVLVIFKLARCDESLEAIWATAPIRTTIGCMDAQMSAQPSRSSEPLAAARVGAPVLLATGIHMHCAFRSSPE